MGFPRQEYWSELPFPSPGDLPDPGIEPTFPALAGEFFTAEPPGKTKEGIHRRRDILPSSVSSDVEKGVATHSSIPAWRSPWTEPGGFPVQGIARVGHDLSD
ncbi:hypothetical protein R6Z07F_006097 [Ovis aries]